MSVACLALRGQPAPTRITSSRRDGAALTITRQDQFPETSATESGQLYLTILDFRGSMTRVVWDLTEPPETHPNLQVFTDFVDHPLPDASPAGIRIYQSVMATHSRTAARNRPTEFISKLQERYLIYDKNEGCPHPQWPWGRAVVVMSEVSDASVASKLLDCANRHIPSGLRSASDVSDRGHVELKPGDALFTRILGSTHEDIHSLSPSDDDLQAWVTDHHVMMANNLVTDDSIQRRLTEVTEQVLGPMIERTNNPPDSTMHPRGGIALERLLWRVTPKPSNNQGKRCYSMGYTLEGPRSLAHPARTMKHRPDIPADEDMRVQLLQTMTEYGGIAMLHAPKDRRDLLENIGCINNIPPLGHSNNKNYWTGFQVNVSKPVLDGSGSHLKDDLGRAGDAHPDTRDEIGSYSLMLYPRVFFLLEFGIFIEMRKSTAIAFSGLRLHGRAPSTAPPGMTEIPDDVYSVTTVLYHRSNLANIMKSRISLFPPPIEKKSAIELGVQALPPEAWRQEITPYLHDSSRPSNMMTDGHMVGGERYPVYMIKLLGSLLDYLNKFSPVYVYDWNPNTMASHIRVKERGSNDDLTLDHLVVDDDESIQISLQWDKLVRRQRLLLGGPTAVEGTIPSRPHGKIELQFVARAPEILGNLQSARPRGIGDAEGSTSTLKEAERQSLMDRSGDHNQDGERQTESDVHVTEPEDSEYSESEERQKKRRRGNPVDKDATGNAKKGKEQSPTKLPVGATRVRIDYKASVLEIFDRNALQAIIASLAEEIDLNPNVSTTYSLPKSSQIAVFSTKLLAFTKQDGSPERTLQTANDILVIMDQLKKGRTSLKRLGIARRVIRHGVMMGVWKIWEFMEVQCRKACEDVLKKNRTNWLTQLVNKVLDHFTQCHSHQLDLDAKDYLPDYPNNCKAVIPPTRLRLVNDGENRDHCHEVVSDEVIKILCLWLGYSRKPGKDSLWQDQGVFIDILVTLTGNSFLCFLDEVWEAFEHPRELIRIEHGRKPVSTRWVELEEEIKARINTRGERKIRERIKENNNNNKLQPPSNGNTNKPPMGEGGDQGSRPPLAKKILRADLIAAISPTISPPPSEGQSTMPTTTNHIVCYKIPIQEPPGMISSMVDHHVNDNRTSVARSIDTHFSFPSKIKSKRVNASWYIPIPNTIGPDERYAFYYNRSRRYRTHNASIARECKGARFKGEFIVFKISRTSNRFVNFQAEDIPKAWIIINR
ncbi:hypothetical protein OE88DRAFT_1647016 [Heliocybe sulcata]|uniref:Uncharacterized protein n=1 Tax=Heliocybe sulcata TaxID=5364 RepID=A0A5C3N3Q3_9AGAM|nr:hypothetical protein OE88DRAFT_1647016 [Heliocybe sulcata]